MSVRENITLTHLETYCRLEFVNTQARDGGGAGACAHARRRNSVA